MKLSEPVFWETGQERCWTEQIDALVHRYRQQGRSVGQLLSTPTPATRVPEQPMGIEDYLGRLAEDGLAEAACMHHPRCLGHMTSPLPVFMPQLSRLVTSFNQNLMKTESSGGLTALERNTLIMLHRTVFDLDEQSYHKMSTDSQSTPGLIHQRRNAGQPDRYVVRQKAGLHRPGDLVAPTPRAGLHRCSDPRLPADALLVRQGDGSTWTVVERIAED